MIDNPCSTLLALRHTVIHEDTDIEIEIDDVPIMRLLILSDLHHELWRQFAPRIDPTISRPDVVVLAGDINTGAKAIDWAAKTFVGMPVLYVHGNHEAYGDTIEDIQKQIQLACDATPNVHFLNCGEFLYEGVRFLGATLWTDFGLFGNDDRRYAMIECQDVMTDYKRIRVAQKG